MPTVFRRSNGIYYALVNDPDGHRKWVSTRSRSKPEALKRLAVVTQRAQTVLSRRKLSQFKEELLDFASHTFARETVSVYQRALSHLLEVVGDRNLDMISARHVDEFKKARMQRVSPVTLNLELRSLRAAFNTAVRWEYLPSNPFTRVKLCRIDDTAPPYLSVNDFKTIIRGLPDEWFRRAVIIGALTGLRRGELVNLQWSDVDLERRLIRVQSRGDFRTKQGRRRIVPMNPYAHTIFVQLHDDRNGSYVLHEGGEKILDRRLTMKFRKHLRKLKMDERIHYHSLRHSFASWLIQSGAASIYEVQKLLGHSSIKTTEIYSHLLPESLMRSVENLPVRLD
jgi:integrase